MPVHIWLTVAGGAMLHGRILNYLDEVARTGSIRKAAERLHVSPTAVNRQILALEDQMQVTLFQRLPRGMKLTAAGEALMEHVRQTLRGYRSLEARLEDMRAIRGGDVRLATMHGLASGLVPAATGGFAVVYPRVRVSVHVMFIAGILRAVVEGDVDLGLGYNLPRDPQLAVMGAYDAPLGAVVAPDHPLAAQARVRLGDCAGYPLVMADESMLMHQAIRDALVRANLDLRPQYLSNSIDFMRRMAISGEGVAFLSPYDVAEEVARGDLVHVPIHDREMAPNVLTLVWRKSRSLDMATLRFTEYLEQRLSQVPAGSPQDG